MKDIHVDSVTLDIVKDTLIAVSNEVFYAFARTSMSPIIYETLDYASGIADVDGNLLTQGNGACGFIGLISPMIQDTVAKYGKENMKPEDVYIINDPYMGGGTHLSDIGMVMPVFYKGELLAFIGNKAHWSDVGGMAAGSFTTDSTEV
ncbi:MAG: hydantoinase B/oxoprolinase family protein, partial [Lachnospiraceae bacterium]